MSQNRSFVLIETSWNVKLHFPCFQLKPRRINRNIMECKVHITKGQVSACPVLIETSWNVKLYTTFYIVSIHRINRNIVECKDAISINFMHLIICINRSIVECKGTTLDLLWVEERVLIETSWNVKFWKSTPLTSGFSVLIETLWNVKLINSTSQSISVS